MSVCRPEAGLTTAERSSGSQKPRTVALNFVIKVSTVSHDTWGSKGRLTEVTSLSTQLSSPFPTSLLSLKEEEKNVNLVSGRLLSPQLYNHQTNIENPNKK